MAPRGLKLHQATETCGGGGVHLGPGGSSQGQRRSPRTRTGAAVRDEGSDLEVRP